MITWRGLICAFAIVLALASTPAAAGPAEEASAVIDKWVSAFNTNDSDAVVKLYTPDAALLGTSSPYLSQGTDEIRTYFSRLPRSGDKVVISMRRMTILADNIVVASGFYDFTLVQNAKLVVGPARFSMVIIKRGDTWLIAQHHSSQRPRTPQ